MTLCNLDLDGKTLVLVLTGELFQEKGDGLNSRNTAVPVVAVHHLNGRDIRNGSVVFIHQGHVEFTNISICDPFRTLLPRKNGITVIDTISLQWNGHVDENARWQFSYMDSQSVLHFESQSILRKCVESLFAFAKNDCLTNNFTHCHSHLPRVLRW